jgi:hypothetical protein
MTLAYRFSQRIDPGGLIARIPALLRCWPTDSVVLVGFTARPPGLTVQHVLRIDIPDAGQVAAVSEQASMAVIAEEIDLVAVVIIAEADERSIPVPHCGVQQALVRAFHDAHVEVTDALWVGRIEPGRTWKSYMHCNRAGSVPPLGPAVPQAA